MRRMEQVFREHFQTVYKYLFCLTRDAHWAEELTQETFYQALKSIKNYRGDCKISVWLCQIAKHLWLKDCKKRNRSVTLPLDHLEMEWPSPAKFEDELIFKEARQTLYGKIEKLDELAREVVYLRILGELSYREIGDILNKNETWARITFYRAKQKMIEGEET